MTLLERAFSLVLQRYLPPLFETVLHRLDAIYPHYYHTLCSTSVSPQSNRYVISLFGILQIVLRTPTFIPPRSAIHSDSPHQRAFVQVVKFAQLSNEIVDLWLEDPISIIDDSAESVSRTAVRIAVLGFAMEVHSRLTRSKK